MNESIFFDDFPHHQILLDRTRSIVNLIILVTIRWDDFVPSLS